MVLKMGRASEECRESVIQRVPTCCAILSPPGIRCLRLKRLAHQRHSLIKSPQDLFLRWRVALGEFPIPITHISRLSDLRADIVIQIPNNMQRQMPKAIPVRIGLRPKFLFREFLRKSAYSLSAVAIGTDKPIRNYV